MLKNFPRELKVTFVSMRTNISGLWVLMSFFKLRLKVLFLATRQFQINIFIESMDGKLGKGSEANPVSMLQIL